MFYCVSEILLFLNYFILECISILDFIVLQVKCMGWDTKFHFPEFLLQKLIHARALCVQWGFLASGCEEVTFSHGEKYEFSWGFWWPSCGWHAPSSAWPYPGTIFQCDTGLSTRNPFNSHSLFCCLDFFHPMPHLLPTSNLSTYFLWTEIALLLP